MALVADVRLDLPCRKVQRTGAGARVERLQISCMMQLKFFRIAEVKHEGWFGWDSWDTWDMHFGIPKGGHRECNFRLGQLGHLRPIEMCGVPRIC